MQTNPEQPQAPVAEAKGSAGAGASQDESLVESLVEDVSIDGMCGVY